MIEGDDDLMFSDDADGASVVPTAPAQRWKMLIVDDEPEVHSITKLVLVDFAFKGRPAQFLSAYSAAEAIAILAREDDIAVILLDVVMETDDAGLRLVHHIREVMGNRHVRIILRTGQPGQAPERSVILEYDINDYKAKTQLTAQQLFTCTVAALRSYEDIMTIDANRRGLEKIIEASSSLFQATSMKLFAAGVLTQLSALVGSGPDAILCVQRGRVFGSDSDDIFVLAGSGRFESLINEPVANHVEPFILQAIMHCLEQGRNIYGPVYCALYIRTPHSRESVVFLHSDRPLNGLDEHLIELFCARISVGFDNLQRYELLLKSHEATLATLAELVEPPATEARDTCLRIAALAEAIARQLRLRGQFLDQINGSFLEWIRGGAILHDIGNLTIDRQILEHPGLYQPAERSAMQRHPAAGSEILERARQRVPGPSYLKLAAEVARWHHENLDGSGYPDQLDGDRIPLAARIVAVADTYVALVSDRPYRPALPPARALEHIRVLAGSRFDPRVVDAFLAIFEPPNPETAAG